MEYLTLLSAATGEWGPPKGHCDPGETNLDTAWRETEEESGLHRSQLQRNPWFEIQIGYTVPAGDKIVWFGLAELTSGDVVLSSEHVDARWETLDATIEVLSWDLPFERVSTFLKDPALQKGLSPVAAKALAFVAPGLYAVVAKSGRFSLENVAPGHRTLHVWHPRFPPASRTLDLAPNSVARVDIQLGVERAFKEAQQ